MSSIDLGTESPDSASARVPQWRGVLALVLVVLLVLGLVACGYLVYRLANPTERPLAPFSSGSKVYSDKERGRAVAVAQLFALRMDNVDSADLDGYIEDINKLQTTKAKAKNKEAFDTLKQTYQVGKIKGTGKVLVSGVADLDEDSATVLVAHDASVKSTAGTVQRHYRWNVELVKVDGKWLVDDFNPVN